MIRPVFANTASARTRRGLVQRGGGWGAIHLRVRCGLIRHPTVGPILIDAGYGPRAKEGPARSFALKTYARLAPMALNPLESPLALLADHGLLPEDVKLVLVTHLHADHVCYLRDLPNARFMTDGQTQGRLRHFVFNELLPNDFADRQVDIRTLDERTMPFDLGQGFDVLGDGSVLAVPLPGHAPGHFGVCFPGDTPLLYAVDTQWTRGAVDGSGAPGFLTRMLGVQNDAATRSNDLVRRFAAAGGDVVLCHDPAPTRYDWAPTDV